MYFKGTLASPLCFQRFPSLLYEQILLSFAFFPLPPCYLQTVLRCSLLTFLLSWFLQWGKYFEIPAIFFKLLFFCFQQKFLHSRLFKISAVCKHFCSHICFDAGKQLTLSSWDTEVKEADVALEQPWAGAEMSEGARNRSVYQVNTIWGKGNKTFLMNWGTHRFPIKMIL